MTDREEFVCENFCEYKVQWFCIKKEKDIVWQLGAGFCQFGVQVSTGYMPNFWKKMTSFASWF